jgi:hypothetical protein
MVGGTYMAANALWEKNIAPMSNENQQIFIYTQMYSGSYNPLLIERLKK